MTTFKKNFLKLGIIFFIILIPFLNADYSDDIKAVPVSQEDISFYEINPCKVSFFEFINTQKEVLYQDHFFLRFNNVSSIACFGRVSGVTVLKDGFYISIGTNPFVSFLIQSLIWIILFSLIKKSNKELDINRQAYFFSLCMTSLLFIFSIYAEQRFYSKNFFFLDFEERRSFIFLFILLFSTLYYLIKTIHSRFHNLINLIPFSFLLMGVFNGFNLSIYSLVIVFYGFYSFAFYKQNNYFRYVFFTFSVFWVLNTSNRYYFAPGKFRGFTNSIYEFNSVLFWTVFLYLLIRSFSFFYINTKESFNFLKFKHSAQITTIFLIILGYIGANFPFFNFFNYIVFGQQKFGINLNNPFVFDEYAEKISWRGFYTSAETAGEFYGLTLLFIIYFIFKNKKINLFDFISFIFAAFGLYFSNNRTVLALLTIFVIYFFISKYKIYRQNKFLILGILALVPILFNLSNFGYSYSYTMDLIYGNALIYRYDTVTSSFLNFLISIYENNSLSKYFIGLISSVSFFINRSVLWGIFSARYNPTYTELLFGSGPFTLGQTYGEIVIKDTESFLLPHSSVLTFLVYFGILGLLLLIASFLFIYQKKKINIEPIGKAFIIFISIIVIKNDVLNYLPAFMFYTTLIYIAKNVNNKKAFRD